MYLFIGQTNHSSHFQGPAKDVPKSASATSTLTQDLGLPLHAHAHELSQSIILGGGRSHGRDSMLGPGMSCDRLGVKTSAYIQAEDLELCPRHSSSFSLSWPQWHLMVIFRAPLHFPNRTNNTTVARLVKALKVW